MVKVRLCDFSGSLLVDEVVADELEAKRLHLLRRGRILTDEELVADEVEPERAAAGFSRTAFVEEEEEGEE